MTRSHTNGGFRLAWLAEDEVIDGVSCSRFRFLRAVFHGGGGTEFYDNGRLKRATLSRNAVIQGRSFKKNTVVTFDRNGRLIPQR